MAFTDRLANRGSISTDTSYSIGNSICFIDNVNGSDSNDWMKATNDWAYAYPGGPVSQEYTSLTTATLSFWMKRGQPSGSTEGIVSGFSSARYGAIFLNTDQKLTFSHPLATTAPTSHMSFEDYSAWYHMVLALDTTSGTATNRERFYVNGVEVDWATAPSWTQNQTFSIFSHSPSWLSIGAGGHYGNNDENSFTGYLAEWHFVDGQQLAPTEFGEFNDEAIWIPKKYDGTYGGTGHYLKFDDASNLGHDEDVHSGSGGPLHLDEQGLTTQNQSTDTPTNNFCTLNPIDMTVASSYKPTITQGNLKYEPSGAGASAVRGTMGMSKGKWYWEIKMASSSSQGFGVAGASAPIPLASSSGNGFMYYTASGDAHSFYINSTSTYTSYRSYDGSNSNSASSFNSGTTSAGDIMMCAFDADNGKLYLGKAGSWTDVKASQDPASGANAAYHYNGEIDFNEEDFFLPHFTNSYNQDMQVNFGGTNVFSISSGNADGAGYGNFEYAVPSGFYALCSKNLATYG